MRMTLFVYVVIPFLNYEQIFIWVEYPFLCKLGILTFLR